MYFWNSIDEARVNRVLAQVNKRDIIPDLLMMLDKGHLFTMKLSTKAKLNRTLREMDKNGLIGSASKEYGMLINGTSPNAIKELFSPTRNMEITKPKMMISRLEIDRELTTIIRRMRANVRRIMAMSPTELKVLKYEYLSNAEFAQHALTALKRMKEMYKTFEKLATSRANEWNLREVKGEINRAISKHSRDAMNDVAKLVLICEDIIRMHTRHTLFVKSLIK